MPIPFRNMSNGGEHQAGQVVIIVEEHPGWLRLFADFPTEFQRQVERERVPGLIHRTLTDHLLRHPEIKVRSSLGIVEEGFTVAVHVWFDRVP